MLSHRTRPVAPPLAPHVEHLWTVRGRLPGRLRNMILPDGAMELIVNLGDPQRLCAPDNLFRAFSGLTPANYLSKRGPFLNYLQV